MLSRRSEQAFLGLLCLADLGVTSACWIAAYFFRWSTSVVPAVDSAPPPLWWCMRTLPIILGAALVSYQMTGLYQLGTRWRLLREFQQVFKATALMLLFVLAASFYVSDPYRSRMVSVVFWVSSFIGLIVLRRALGVYFRIARGRGKAAGRALIVGTGRTARNIERVLRSNHWLGLQPLGFVDDLEHSKKIGGPQIVGSTEDLPELIEQHRIDYVFLALPLEKYQTVRTIVRNLADTLVEVRLVPDIPRHADMTVQVQELEGLPILNLRSTTHHLGEIAAKRVMDVVLSAVGLFVLSPLLGLIALLIKWSDGGPIFYVQERMGFNGRRFRMFKFRSMRMDAENSTGPVWAKPGDDRRTRLGAFLRASSIDELPQLYNVLRGDMSLVGPRPERPFFINHFRKSVPRYMLRHAVKAGITGWAQVNGWRGNTSLRKRVQYDLYYISNWSVWLDLRILTMTVLKTIWDKNAY